MRFTALRKNLTWLSPIAVVTMAEPKPVVTDTLIPPIMLQTMMYHSMFFLPYLTRVGRNGGAHLVYLKQPNES